MSDLITKYNEPISQNFRNLISNRYHRITKIFNQQLWENYDNDDTSHSIYVGSYGRHTAIDSSDIDILLRLPDDEFERFKDLKSNGQSYLLQILRDTIKQTYPNSEIKADGQVVKINFYDQIKFELLPVFMMNDGSYSYPDSSNGGNWKNTNPKFEQEAIYKKNDSSNGLFRDTCKHFRYIRDNYYSSYHLSGILIDSFVYRAIGNWQWTNNNSYNDISSSNNTGDYELSLLNYYNNSVNRYISSPDDNYYIDTINEGFCLKKVLERITNGI